MKRELGHIKAYEFRADSQPKLLRRIAKWYAEEEKKAKIPSFLLDIRLDLREENVGEKDAYTALIYLDGPFK